MKGDCQPFRVAGQRRFGGVWDEFSRGFPMLFLKSRAERLPKSRAERGIPIVLQSLLGLQDFFYRKGRRGRKGRRILFSFPKTSFPTTGFPRCARDKSPYSYFSALSGSTFIARRAGMYEATRPTAASSTATEMSVTGSDG